MAERPGGPRRDHIVRETQQIQIALAYPAATVSSPDYYRARAATAILGGFSSARLFTEVREKPRLVLLSLRNLRRPNSIGPPCFATREPRSTGRSKPST